MEQRFEVDRRDLSRTRVAQRDPAALDDGCVRLAVERFALTANNITYAVVGDRLGYWHFFPAREEWGVVPVWGFANVVESRCADVDVGERLYGFWPMGTHCDLTPGKVSAASLMDSTAHRRDLPAVYNAYARTSGEGWYDASMDDERMLLFPLYATSFCLYDFLLDNAFFGAEQIIISSASSKTAIGLGYALAEDAEAPPRVALTSGGNVGEVGRLGLYGDVHSYDVLDAIDTGRATVIVDMSGNGRVLSQLHHRLGDHMRFTSNVGVTHYDLNEMGEHYIAERSAMFFAPAHIKKRAEDWGPGAFEKKALEFWQRAAGRSREWLDIVRVDGLDGLAEAYRRVLEGGYPPTAGVTVVL